MGAVRHNRDRESPFPEKDLIHYYTRTRELIDKLYSHGICVSYKRLLSISTDLANTVCAYCHEHNVVCPPNLKSGLFTTGAVDNIDHNPSSTSAKNSFHGTAISITQHPSLTVSGEDRKMYYQNEGHANNLKITPLPDIYSEVPPCSSQFTEYVVPDTDMITCSNSLEMSLASEIIWLNKIAESLKHENMKPGDYVSWSVNHAAAADKHIRPKCENALLPFFVENANTLTMVKHSMFVVQQAIHTC